MDFSELMILIIVNNIFNRFLSIYYGFNICLYTILLLHIRSYET